MARRMPPEDRKELILIHAVLLAEKIGYDRVTRAQVAGLLKISPSLINRYYPTVRDLHKAVLRRAIEDDWQKIIALAVVNKDPCVKNMKKADKAAAVKYLSKNY